MSDKKPPLNLSIVSRLAVHMQDTPPGLTPEMTFIMKEIGVMTQEMVDEIDGLRSDLTNAVETAFRRGATEWTRLNYPAIYERLTTGDEDK